MLWLQIVIQTFALLVHLIDQHPSCVVPRMASTLCCKRLLLLQPRADSKPGRKYWGNLRYIVYRNFINDLIKHVSLLILVHVRLLFCPNCLLHALLLLKNIGLDTTILFTKGTELTIFGQLKILMMFSINLNLKTFRLLNCLHMIFLHCILRYLIIL